MPIKHVVLLPFKETLADDEIIEIMIAVEDLKNKIPEIMSCSWGKNNSPEGLERGYGYGFVMEFFSHEDRQRYLEHPEHIKIAREKVLPALCEGIESALVFDYEY